MTCEEYKTLWQDKLDYLAAMIPSKQLLLDSYHDTLQALKAVFCNTNHPQYSNTCCQYIIEFESAHPVIVEVDVNSLMTYIQTLINNLNCNNQDWKCVAFDIVVNLNQLVVYYEKYLQYLSDYNGFMGWLADNNCIFHVVQEP